MLNLNTFFNTNIIDKRVYVYYNREEQSIVTVNGPNFGNKLFSLSNNCFAPIRELFKGDTVIIELKGGKSVVTCQKREEQKRPLLSTVAAIVLLIPGIIFGTLLKALSLLSSPVREAQSLAMKSGTSKTPEKNPSSPSPQTTQQTTGPSTEQPERLKPLKITLGSENQRLDYEAVLQLVQEIQKRQQQGLKNPIKTLIIWTSETKGRVVDVGSMKEIRNGLKPSEVTVMPPGNEPIYESIRL